jgi:retinol dehydrogenase-12
MSLHPGLVKTDLTRYTGFLAQRVGRMLSYDVSYGAITSLYAGTAPAAGELNGKVGTAYICLWIFLSLPGLRVIFF